MRRLVVAAVSAITVATAAVTAGAAEIAVYSGGAPEAALRALAPAFETASGHRVQFTFAIVTALQKRLLAGETADLVFMPMPLLAELAKARPLRPEGRGVLARVGLAVVVREGAPKPDIASAEALRKLLLSAKSIALSEANTPGGSYVLRMLAQLGIADEVKSRLALRSAIGGGGALVADGAAEVGLYLNSEMQTVKGITVVGLLPPPLQFFVVYGTAIPVSNTEPTPALAFIDYLTAPERAASWTRAGFEVRAPPK
ncbi:MAG: substrate-binding domain-containing protein [Hyphomicrobiales bacterium]|nr:substrate-binding domain-containing protein [Hyphomicrobiales bacterium]